MKKHIVIICLAITLLSSVNCSAQPIALVPPGTTTPSPSTSHTTPTYLPEPSIQSPTPNKTPAPTPTLAGMAELYLKWQQGVKFIDIRTPDELITGGSSGESARGLIPGAINIDYYSPDFREQLARLNHGKPYVLYCRTGNRSASALPIMQGLNFAEVYNMGGGFMEWKAQGYPLEYR